jgi:hypothetical protein
VHFIKQVFFLSEGYYKKIHKGLKAIQFFGFFAGFVDQDTEGPIRPSKNKNKDKDISCFKELDVLSGELEACSSVWKLFRQF